MTRMATGLCVAAALSVATLGAQTPSTSTQRTDAAKEITLTGEYKFRNLVTRVEYRTDFSDEPFFTTRDGLSKDQPTFTFGVLYAFTSAKQ